MAMIPTKETFVGGNKPPKKPLVFPIRKGAKRQIKVFTRK